MSEKRQKTEALSGRMTPRLIDSSCCCCCCRYSDQVTPPFTNNQWLNPHTTLEEVSHLLEETAGGDAASSTGHKEWSCQKKLHVFSSTFPSTFSSTFPSTFELTIPAAMSQAKLTLWFQG